MSKSDFYYRCLNKYFYKHYGEYEFDAQWFIDPAENQWKFYIPEVGLLIALTCDEYGHITKTEESLG